MMAEAVNILTSKLLANDADDYSPSKKSVAGIGSVAREFSSSRILKDAGTREVVNSLYSFARMADLNPQIRAEIGKEIQKIASAAKHRLPDMNDRDLAIFARAALEIGLDYKKFVEPIETAAQTRIANMESEPLTDIAQMHGLIGSPDAYLALPISEALEGGLGTWEMHEIVRVSNSLGSIYSKFQKTGYLETLPERDRESVTDFIVGWPARLDQVLERLILDVDKMNLAQLYKFSSLVRSSERQSETRREALEAIDRHAGILGADLHRATREQFENFPKTVHRIVSIANNLYRSGMSEPTCVNPMLSVLRYQPGCLDGIDAARLVYILSGQSDRFPELFEQLATIIIKDKAPLEAGHIVRTMSAFDRKNVDVPNLFRKLESNFALQMKGVSNVDLSDFVHALAGLAAMSPDTAISVIDELERREKEGRIATLEGIAGTVLGLALDERTDFDRVWRLVMRVGRFSTLSDDAASMLYRAGIGRGQEIPNELEGKFSGRTVTKRLGLGSRLEESAIDPLEALAEKHGASLIREYQVLDFCLDFAIRTDDKIIGMELDGTTFHIVGGKENGKRRPRDVMRDGILKRAGIIVVRISDIEWGEVPFEKRMDYLESRILSETNFTNPSPSVQIS